MPTVPYTCTGQEAPGNAALYGPDEQLVTVIWASRCYADWYCQLMGYTWGWYDGVDPDAPPPEDPPVDPDPV